jgi:hypothetical protein
MWWIPSHKSHSISLETCTTVVHEPFFFFFLFLLETKLLNLKLSWEKKTFINVLLFLDPITLSLSLVYGLTKWNKEKRIYRLAFCQQKKICQQVTIIKIRPARSIVKPFVRNKRTFRLTSSFLYFEQKKKFSLAKNMSFSLKVIQVIFLLKLYAETNETLIKKMTYGWLES